MVARGEAVVVVVVELRLDGRRAGRRRRRAWRAGQLRRHLDLRQCGCSLDLGIGWGLEGFLLSVFSRWFRFVPASPFRAILFPPALHLRRNRGDFSFSFRFSRSQPMTAWAFVHLPNNPPVSFSFLSGFIMGHRLLFMDLRRKNCEGDRSALRI